MNHKSTTKIAQASPERYIPELEDPMFRIVVSFAGSSNLANVVNNLSMPEVREMAEYIEGMREETKQVFLAFDAEVPEDGGFWAGTVLPLLRRRLLRPVTSKVDGDSLFATVKAAVTITDLAGRFTELKPAGAGKLKGNCPIHSENTPSFFVYLDTHQWRCYGACADGGDVVYLAQRLMDVGAI